MTLVVAIALLGVVALTSGLLPPLLHHAKAAAELRGDWWSRFENEFQAYSSRTWEEAREAERRP